MGWFPGLRPGSIPEAPIGLMKKTNIGRIECHGLLEQVEEAGGVEEEDLQFLL